VVRELLEGRTALYLRELAHELEAAFKIDLHLWD
jgi:hypothetical protein